jgi:transcriptional regulator with XRE-family HTH domain
LPLLPARVLTYANDPQARRMTADDLRALRKRLGMTQAQLAAKLDLTVRTIAYYEGGHGPYKIPRVVALACKTLVNEFLTPR